MPFATSIRSLLLGLLVLPQCVTVARADTNELVEKPLAQIANVHLSEHGQLALSLKPEKWRHAETENFILHFRRVTEAKKVARETESYAVFILNFLGETPTKESSKSNIFIFEDEEEWATFAGQSGVPSWTVSYAIGDDLYLNVRSSGQTGRFDSITLAHETAHAVVSRVFPRTRWPLWLNEGFAQYIAGRAVAARKGQYAKGNQRRLDMADLTVEELELMTEYPASELMVAKLYQSSEKVVRFLVNEHGQERFVKLVKALAGGETFAYALQTHYGDLYPTTAAFQKKLENYRK